MGTPINRLESIWPKTEAEGMVPREESASWSGKAKSWEHKIEAMLAEHAKLTIAAAVGLGLFLGFMVKRK